MSVLIQGMEMPEFFDRLFVGRSFDGRIYIRNEREDRERESPTWYPVIEIPPHGRLIDADELTKNIFGSSLSGREWSEQVLTKDKNELQTALFNLPIMFNNAPTIIPADKED